MADMITMNFAMDKIANIQLLNRAIRTYGERIDAINSEVMDMEDVHDQLLYQDCDTQNDKCPICKQIKDIEERMNKLDDLYLALLTKTNEAGQKLENALNELFSNEYIDVELTMV